MPGIGLSPEGEEQAKNLAARLETLPIAAIVASPMQRAQETAKAVSARHGLDIQTDPGFDEIDFGAWTGNTFEDLAPDPAWQTWNRERSTAGCPGGETMADAQSRALQALVRLLAAYPEQQIVIVSHADILKSLLAPVLGLSLDHLHRLTIDPASISTLLLFEDDMRIDGINR